MVTPVTGPNPGTHRGRDGEVLGYATASPSPHPSQNLRLWGLCVRFGGSLSHPQVSGIPRPYQKL